MPRSADPQIENIRRRQYGNRRGYILWKLVRPFIPVNLPLLIWRQRRLTLTRLLSNTYRRALLLCRDDAGLEDAAGFDWASHLAWHLTSCAGKSTVTRHCLDASLSHAIAPEVAHLPGAYALDVKCGDMLVIKPAKHHMPGSIRAIRDPILDDREWLPTDSGALLDSDRQFIEPGSEW